LTSLGHSKSAAEPANALTFRTSVVPSDVEAIRDIVTSSGFFSEAEIVVAQELAEDRLIRGEKSDYRFVFAQLDSKPVAYASYGLIECTQGSFDLYWIAVHEHHRGKGIGRALLQETERLLKHEGARRVYVETSSREQYRPTRTFYERCGYFAEATFADFYAPGDGKIVYVKAI
jgi:GNAT superfamily N-acetyltransferase